MIGVNYKAVFLLYVGSSAVSFAIVRGFIDLCVVFGGAYAVMAGLPASATRSASSAFSVSGFAG